MSNLHPINDRVLVLLDGRKAESEGGIAIPDAARAAECWGTVERAGPKCRDLAPGDRVWVAPHLGTHYVEGGRDYVLIDEGRVACREARVERREFTDGDGVVVGMRVTNETGEVTDFGKVPATA